MAGPLVLRLEVESHCLLITRNLMEIVVMKLHFCLQMSEATMGVSITPDRNHLTAMEIYMLKNPDMLKNVR